MSVLSSNLDFGLFFGDDLMRNCFWFGHGLRGEIEVAMNKFCAVQGDASTSSSVRVVMSGVRRRRADAARD